MRHLRRLTLLAAVAAGSAVLAAPAFGAYARPNPAAYPFTVGTAHFLVHYTSSPGSGGAITQTTAGDVAARAERAYAAELADGYPAPLSDGGLGGDDRIDIYVSDLGGLALGVAEWDADNPQTSGFVELAGEDPDHGLDQHTIAHELFHVVQMGIWLPASAGDFWLLEGSAEWMGYRVNGYSSSHPFGLGPSDMSLDCRDALGTNKCDLSDVYDNNGYSRWPFFEYVVENYGSSFVKDVFAQGAAGASSATAALASALAARGTTLTDVYLNWIAADMSGGYSVKALQGLRPSPYTSIETGTEDATFSIPKIAVNHLSTRYVKFTRGDDDSSHVCYDATLSISVTIPAGTSSRPVFFWDSEGSHPVPLSVSGSTASASIPWDTCTYQTNAGYLAIPNPSTSVDAADFVVSASMTVDETHQATPAPPPAPLDLNTPVVSVDSVDVAPTLMLFGPEILKLSTKQTTLRLIVQSDGPGSVRARLGSIDLGTRAIRAGANDVRLALPKQALRSLRRSAAASRLLTLTPVSEHGSVTGTAVSRTVRVAAAKKPARRK